MAWPYRRGKITMAIRTPVVKDQTPVTIEEDQLLISARVAAWGERSGYETAVEYLREVGLPVPTGTAVPAVYSLDLEKYTEHLRERFGDTIDVSSTRSDTLYYVAQEIAHKLYTDVYGLIKNLPPEGETGGMVTVKMPEIKVFSKKEGDAILSRYGSNGSLPPCATEEGYAERARIVREVLKLRQDRRDCTVVTDAIERMGLRSYMPRQVAQVRVDLSKVIPGATGEVTRQVPTNDFGELLQDTPERMLGRLAPRTEDSVYMTLSDYPEGAFVDLNPGALRQDEKSRDDVE